MLVRIVNRFGNGPNPIGGALRERRFVLEPVPKMNFFRATIPQFHGCRGCGQSFDFDGVITKLRVRQ